MTNILLAGCNGKMGKVIRRLVKDDPEFAIIAGVDLTASSDGDFPVFTDFVSISGHADVIVDFTSPDNLERMVEYAVAKNIPVVVATTGLSEGQKIFLSDISRSIPVFYSANMSYGVNLVINILKKIASAAEDDFDIEIVEKHHNQKIDAPSGTALAIADAINSSLSEKHEYIFDRTSRREKRKKSEIGIVSVGYDREETMIRKSPWIKF